MFKLVPPICIPVVAFINPVTCAPVERVSIFLTPPWNNSTAPELINCANKSPVADPSTVILVIPPVDPSSKSVFVVVILRLEPLVSILSLVPSL